MHAGLGYILNRKKSTIAHMFDCFFPPCSAINELQDVCFQDQNGFLTKLSSSTSLTFGTVNGPVLGGMFAAREENLKAVIGDLGTSPFGGNVMLSGNAENGRCIEISI